MNGNNSDFYIKVYINNNLISDSDVPFDPDARVKKVEEIPVLIRRDTILGISKYNDVQTILYTSFKKFIINEEYEKFIKKYRVDEWIIEVDEDDNDDRDQ